MPRALCAGGLLIALAGFAWSLIQYAVAPQVLLSLNDAVARQQRRGGLGQGVENLAGEPRVAILQHPPGRLEWTLTLPRGRHRFSVGLGVKEEAWTGSDGVTFQSSVIEQGETRTLIDKTIVPRAHGEHRRWVSVQTEFSTIGREIVLVFETGAGPAGNDNYDWALWSDPQIETIASPLQWSLVGPGWILVVVGWLLGRTLRVPLPLLGTRMLRLSVLLASIALGCVAAELALRALPRVQPTSVARDLRASVSRGTMSGGAIPDDSVGFLGIPSECVRYPCQEMFNVVYPQVSTGGDRSPNLWTRWRRYWWDFESLPSAAHMASDRTEVEVCHDSDGFRNPPGLENARVVVLGDSFVHSGLVQADEMWTAVLADTANVDARNLGVPGFAPQQSAGVLEQFGVEDAPKVVLFGYYEGNDIAEAESSERFKANRMNWYSYQVLIQRANAKSFILPRYSNSLFLEALQLSPLKVPWNGHASVRPIRDGVNPVCGAIAAVDLCMSFERWATFHLSLSIDDWRMQSGWKPTQQAIRSMRAVSDRHGAALAVVLLPTKASIYLPLLAESVPREALGRFVREVAPDEQLPILEYAQRIKTRSRSQSVLLRAFLESEDIPVVDLYDVFAAEAAQGKLLYYPFDTHWNDAGNRLAGETVAADLRARGWLD